jgi:hypothetical protein
MKLTVIALTLLFSTIASAHTKSILDARAMRLHQTSIGTTSGIGPGASSKRAKDAPVSAASNPRNDLTH